VTRRLPRCGLSAVGVLGVAGFAATPAFGAQPLTRGERSAIVRSTFVSAPDGGRIKNWRCIAGQLSTVDRRFASTYLTSTPHCVSRYGGATGEATLDYRPSPLSNNWRAIGVIGGSGACPPSRPAPDKVLRDLGCTTITADLRAVPAGSARDARPPTAGRQAPPDRIAQRSTGISTFVGRWESPELPPSGRRESIVIRANATGEIRSPGLSP
jgi:hypothetical protein